MAVVVVIAAFVVGCVVATPAEANHSQLQLAVATAFVHPGDVDQVRIAGVSGDGRKVWVRTDIPLDSADTDTYYDIYELSDGTIGFISPPPFASGSFAAVAGTSDDASRVFLSDSSNVWEYSNGALTLVSTGPSDSGTFHTRDFLSNTADGSRVLFRTADPLVPEDTDSKEDIYVRDVDTGTTTLMSTGSIGGNGPYDVVGDRYSLSGDGQHVFFTTQEQLVPGDIDSDYDVYERFGATTTLVSTGPSGGNAPFIPSYRYTSSYDGSRVIFGTSESLVPADTDSNFDLYERANGTTTTLLSTGPAGGSGAFDASFVSAAGDATKVFFTTSESLVAGDLDGQPDIYERSAGTTALRSAGSVTTALHVSTDGAHAYYTTSSSVAPGDTNGTFDIYDNSSGADTWVSVGPSGSGTELSPVMLASSDESRVFFTTGHSLVPADTDGTISDVYERFDGKTTLISAAPSGANSTYGVNPYLKASADGKTVAFDTRDPLTADDPDFKWDAYISRVGTEHPKSATHVHMPLVPAFRQTISTTQCQARGGAASTHGAPLSSPSCSPPGYLPNTKGKLGPQGSGSVDLNVIPGDLSTPADEADVSIAASASDVRDRLTGADYAPNASGADVTLNPLMRLTDTDNGATATDSATTIDFDFPIALDCVATADPVTGSTCSVATTADAVTPGFVKEGKQAVLSLNRFWLYDSGANAARGDADDRQFAQQGIYVP